MASVNSIKTSLIEKILSIQSKELLEQLHYLITSEKTEKTDAHKLTKEQMELLKMSEKDIKNGEFISQEAMNQRNLEWLNAI